MRFKQSDLTGIAVSAGIPVLISWIVFNGWQLQHHEGTPLLGQIAVTFAVMGGLAGYLTRYLAHPRTFRILGALLGLVFIGVLELQASGVDQTVWSLALKWLGVLLFVLLKLILIVDVLAVAVNPYLIRRDERQAAGQ